MDPTQQPTTPEQPPVVQPEVAPIPEPEAPLKKKRHLLRGLFYLLVIAAISVGFWQRQNIIDWWKLRGYVAPAKVASLATDTTMSSQGRKIFYIQRPLIQQKAEFYVSCENGETSIVLGCYKPNNGIYVLQVDDQRLDGVEEVTAAHELLHAVYDRLGTNQRKDVSNMLLDAYNKVSDPDIKDKINLYKQSDADISNELHSILGTEVADLPEDLEQYYKRYFTNRLVIVSFANGYKSEFKSRRARVVELDKQLKTIEEQVISDNKALDKQQAGFQAESKRLDNLLKNGQIDEYNQGVAVYNKSLIPFKEQLAKTRNLVAKYKQVLAERNKVASEAQELNKALDSRIETKVEDIWPIP